MLYCHKYSHQFRKVCIEGGICAHFPMGKGGICCLQWGKCARKAGNMHTFRAKDAGTGCRQWGKVCTEGWKQAHFPGEGCRDRLSAVGGGVCTEGGETCTLSGKTGWNGDVPICQYVKEKRVTSCREVTLIYAVIPNRESHLRYSF